MKGSKNTKICASITAIIFIIAISVTFIFTNFNKSKNQTIQQITDPEILRSLSYEQITEEEENEQNEYVKFQAFFTRDLDDDGYAEKLKGTCRNISDTDELYIELNVLTDGYLKNGVIKLNAENFTWKTAIVSDNIVNGNYIGNTTSIKLQDKIPAGSQKILWGTISSKIGNNINNYCKEATITLTGIHVSDDGKTQTPITKTVKVIVDWHGDVGAKITGTKINKDIEDIQLTENTVNFQVDLQTQEPIQKLLLKENVITAEIPQFNGFNPINVTTTGDYTYDKETRILTAKRSSIVDENGNITQTLARYNTYKVNIEYPVEAYVAEANSVTLEIPLTTYYVAYNNSNKQFENPITSDIAKDIVAISYRKPSGYVYNFDITVGKKSRHGYTVSKKKPIQIYNGITEETTEDYYDVTWYLSTGNQGEVTSAVMKETPEKYTDEFLNTSKQFSSMLEYTDNIGIYFSGASSALGENGYINVYNDETNELIHTFTKQDWGNYNISNIYKYETPVKHIRIETSAVARNSYFKVNHIKEINDELLVTNITKQEFDELKYVYSYLQGSVQIAGQAEMGIVNDTGIAKYLEEESIATISTNKYQVETQKTVENFIISINTNENLYNDAKWENGQFIVKLPSEIIATQINNVYTSNDKVKIIGYDLYESKGNYFIKIITENTEETTYRIIIDCNITPDPATKTSTRQFELYAYNEIGEEYYNPVQDIYDVNGNNNIQENINYSTTEISFVAPSTIITSQYLSEYDDENTIKNAPNVANILRQQKTAKINLVLLNNYANNIEEVKILGVIPSKGNSYVINGSELGSEFDVYMSENGIQVPEELKDIVTIYYSEKVNPSKDISDSSNGWKRSPDDWSKVKSYLIDFGDYIIQAGKSYTFSYGIEIPEKVEYNEVSYSEHAVYFALDTEGGKLLTQTEPNKLGIKIIRKYGFNLTKYKEDSDILKVAGATYKIYYTDKNGNTVTKLLTTNLDGIININDLYVGIKYTVKELKSPDNYVLNNEKIEFKVIEDEQGNLKLETTNEQKVTLDKENEIVQIKTEDEPKYNITITKTDASTGEVLPNIKFKLKGRIYRTNRYGQIVIEGLKQNEEYTIEEEEAEGYYKLEEKITFKLIKDEQGNLKIESNCEQFDNALIKNTDEEDLIQISNINIINEKIPTYNLQILKVAENTKENNVNNLEPLSNARFKIKYDDLGKEDVFITDESGSINVYNLYQYVDGKYITGKYTLQEIESPEGYSNNREEISFKVITNEENKLDIQIENKENLTSIKTILIEENTIKIIIQDTPLFKLVKTDSETGEPLANAKFIIKKIDEEGNDIDYAKDINGNYVGELNEEKQYVITTDETGIVTLPLSAGLYKAVEIGYPEGYQENEDKQYFRITGGEEEEQEEGEVIQINNIEDLVRLSIYVNKGNDCKGKIVKLMKSIDFEDDSSYKDPEDISYGDLNEDGEIEGIKLELTDRIDGIGFTPIGIGYGNCFSGTFDGRNNEIRNIYMNGKNGNGLALFVSVKGGTIKNLGLTGGMIESSNLVGDSGGIAGSIVSSNIINCYNTLSVIVPGLGRDVGGIAGYVKDSNISNCYNTGNIKGMSTGGIAGYVEASNITMCYNTGEVYAKQSINVNMSSQYGGGIAGIANDSNIRNCYNEGNVSVGAYSPHAGGIIGTATNVNINNTYNIGNVDNGSSNGSYGATVGAIVAEATNISGSNNWYACSITGKKVYYFGNYPGLNYMKSKNFYNILNTDGVWFYEQNSCPKLLIKARETTNLNFKNTLKTFNITTEIAPNLTNERIGGTITGIYNDFYFEENNIKFVENVKYQNNNTKSIEIKPDNGYKISEITVNGEKIEFTVDDNRSVILPQGYFENVNEDKHIIVKFEKLGNLTIYKVDEDNPNLKLSGAKFKIEAQSIETNGLIGEMQNGFNSSTTHHFTKVGDTYESTNAGVANSVSNSYFPIDLRNYYGVQFILSVNASVSSQGVNYDMGYATITTSKTVPTYDNTSGQFIKIGGTNVETATYNTTLEGGRIYYLHIGYRKNGSTNLGNDKFIINSIDINSEAFNTVVVTDSQGLASIRVPSYRWFSITEIEAPYGYNLDSEQKTVGVSGSGAEVTIKNTAKTCQITTKIEKLPTQLVDGGTISGQGKTPYEEVKYNQTSTKDILIKPDNGYKIVSIKINGTEIKFTPDLDGNVLLDKFENMQEDKEVVVRFETIYEPNFTLVKKDDYTNEPLQGIQFAIYYLSTGEDFAKDKNGLYIGEKDENGMYLVTTDENGEVKLTLPTGFYKVIEVKGADGYVLSDKEEDRTTYFKIVAEADVEINYIEDLIDFSNNVTNGNTYEGKTIVLNRSLDFNDINSYRNANNTTTYEDYNGDGTIENIKTELTNTASSGFKPIGGDPSHTFNGIFDGNGFEIKNLYINSSYGSLFTNVQNGEIRNLKLTNASVTNQSCGAGLARSIQKSKITNCGIDGIVNSSSNAPTGGIAYQANDSEITYCYNNADISGVCTGGISSYINNSLIENCYNTGIITSVGPAGGLAFNIDNSTIRNSYNTGDANGTGTSGGISSSISNSRVENCYNIGNVTDTNSPAGGVAYSITNCKITNFYNKGNISGKSGAGGLGFSISNSNFEHCYNEGEICSTNSSAGGIGVYISNSTFVECYNKGIASSEQTNTSDTSMGAAGFAVTFTNSTAEKCFNEGDITSKANASGFLIISEKSNLEKCYNTGEITATVRASGIVNDIVDCNLKNVYNKGNVTGSNGSVGGISTQVNNSILEKCFNTGNLYSGPGVGGVAYTVSSSTIIKCYNMGNVKAGSTAGGVINSISDTTVQDCYNTGKVISSVPAGGVIYNATNNSVVNNCYNTGDVSGNYSVAGIINDASNTIINNCYNTGIITNGKGIVACNTKSTINNTYYLNNTASQGITGITDTIGIAEAKKSSEMKSIAFVKLLNDNKNLIQTTIPLSNWKYSMGDYPVLDYEIDIYEFVADTTNTDDNMSGNNSEEIDAQKPTITQKYEIVNSQITITNSKSAKVTVHHYLQGTGPEFETEPTVLAPDEVIMGKENYDYATSPKLDIEGYNLIKNVDGEYIIPENASGKFTLEPQDIYYYYNVKPLELVVHHYLEGTEDKLAEDEQYYYNENEHYKTTPSKELLEAYEVALVVGDEEKDITQNEVVTYYYKHKQVKITTRVEIPEAELEAGRTEKGGSILGEGEEPYEIVNYGENSTKDIIATPDNGYKLGSITVNGKVVPFTTNGGVVQIEKFENMTEDKEVVVTFIPTIGKVITHHYLQGTTQKLHDDIINEDKLGAVITTMPLTIDGYKLVDSSGNKDEDGNVVITKEISEGVEEIIYYYEQCYIITTDVIEHEEQYKDGTVNQNVKGGNITDEDVVIHEQVVKYENNEEIIEMNPDEDYEIAEVRINGKTVDLEKDENQGNIVIAKGFFKRVQQNFHVEVGFRRESKVIVKYLEKDTENELSDSTEIIGYEGKDFKTLGKIIPGYTFVKVPVSDESTELKNKITDENNQPINPDGTMFSDDITIIYWYEKINGNVIERHIETNEKGEEIELESVIYNNSTAITVESQRKNYIKYISIDAPEGTKEYIDNNCPNVTLVGKDQNNVTVTVDNTNIKEVWYYYIKQYDITTEVKLHKENVDGNEVEVAGGTISKEYKIDENGEEVEVTYEIVNSRGDNKKEIKITPDSVYRIKCVTINNEEIFIDGMLAEDGTLTLPVAYLKDIQKDYHIAVEFEKIPAKVIVKYIDEYTKESIIPDKIVEGFVNDDYSEERVSIDGYIAVNPEPENSEGKMTEDSITVVYYYSKQFKITTDVIEHLEDKEKSIIDVIVDKIDESLNKEEVLVKGGTIEGEDEEPYELVTRGNENTKQILIKPDEGYRIKSVIIKDGETEYMLSVPDLLTEENTIILPVSYFKNMQSDKHVTVEFEQIPAKVVVNYLDIETKNNEKPEKVSKQEIGEGFVNYNYKTHEKDIPYYELVKEELPANAEGRLTEQDTIVNYWYKKLLFNMKLTKEFSSIQVNGTEVLKENNKFAKVDISNVDVANTNILVKYKITVTNTEKVEGIAKIVENIPVGFKYVPNTANASIDTTSQGSQWKEVDGKLELKTQTLKPGETAQYEITLEWDKTQNCVGTLINTAKITETENVPQFQETTNEDNVDSCTLLLAIRTRENRDIKTVISMSCFILAGICTIVYIGTEVYARRKENK